MKRAPFLCKQSPDRTLEVVILAGSLAWETSRAWRKDPDREDDVPPVVLGPDELADLDNLTIIRPDTLYVRVLRTGDIHEEELLKIAVKLAHADVQMARLMSPDGELLEDWSGQLARLRQERPLTSCRITSASMKKRYGLTSSPNAGTGKATSSPSASVPRCASPLSPATAMTAAMAACWNGTPPPGSCGAGPCRWQCSAATARS